MDFDFDRVVPRQNSDSMKWDRYRGRDVLPLWQADMDFPAAPAIRRALDERLAHGIFGYATASDALEAATLAHLAGRYDWQIEREQLVWLPGLVAALYLSCRAFARPGEGVLIATPVYPHLLHSPKGGDCRAVTVPLRDSDWSWDIDALRAAIGPDTRLLLLCHPHNPVGRRWDEPTLRALAEVAEEFDLTVVSDEVHCDLQLEVGARHRPFASLPGMAERTVTLMSASKTFNLAGLQCAFAVSANPALRHALEKVGNGLIPPPNPFGIAATEAAFRHGGDWLDALLPYLRDNSELVHRTLDGVAGVKVWRPQATYLSWLDCRALDLPSPRAFFEEAGVGLSDGSEFGLPGYARLNFACPRATLEEALRRMRTALERVQKSRSA